MTTGWCSAWCGKFRGRLGVCCRRGVDRVPR